MNNTFYLKLISKINLSINNNYKDNYDFYRFGKENYGAKGIKGIILKYIISKKFLFRWEATNKVLNALELSYKYFNALERIYEILHNKESKELLVDLITYRLLGHKQVKLPINDNHYWKLIEIVKSLAVKNDTIDSHFMQFVLYKFNLNKIGYNIQLYSTTLGIVIVFLLEQYAYKSANKTIVEVEKGEVILDIGACWGDTALYFANKTGEDGKVYSFEFIPDNIKIFNINIELNPSLKDRIELIQHPVSNKSGDKIYYTNNGPGSKIEFEPFDGQTSVATTLSIDDFVNNNNIKKIDFIKMDIEGAELLALEGAIETIKRFKPKLAIAIYHSMDDFVNIPNWINNLNLGYKLYLGHYTIHAEETVIFAKVD